MASAKGFDRQESPRTDFCARILIGLEISRKQLPAMHKKVERACKVEQM